MSKILTTKHICDHNCDHINKSKKKEFQDPLLEQLAKDLEDSYVDMQDKMLAEIFQYLGISEELQKARSHKYIKRTGSPGNYRYWYKLPNGRLVSGDNAPAGHAHHDETKPAFNPASLAEATKIVVKPKDPQAAKTTKKKASKVVARPKGAPKKQLEYKSVHPHVNLVKSVDFSNVSPKTQQKLHKSLNGAETILARMGLKLKTPLHFFTGKSKKPADAYFHPEGNKIEFVDRDVRSETLMHEIGHALDIAINKKDNYFFNDVVEKIKSGKITKQNITPTQKIVYDIVQEAQNSPYYQSHKGDFKKYLMDPTEIFARAFEVYSYKTAKDLVNMGKLDADFMTHFKPDLDRVGDFKESKDYKDLNQQMNDNNKQLIEALAKKDADKVKQLRENENQLKKQFAVKKHVHETMGSRGEGTINKIAGLVEQLLKLEKIKKSYAIDGTTS